jgi:hypothetical protein
MKSKYLSFLYQESAAKIILNKSKEHIFRLLTSNNCKLFLRAKDLISVQPQTTGIWEPEITHLINLFAEDGYNDFFIDIGANVGLTSCQNGRSFKAVHLFEPNPLCCHILEVNCAISLDKSRFTIHPIGLGEEDKTTHLTVPLHNWGGAFVNDKVNSYEKKLLANKDGFEDINSENYSS